MSVCTPRCELFCCTETLLMPNVTGEPSCNLVPSSCSRCQCHVPGAELKHFCCVASHNAPPLRHSSWHLTWFSQVNVFTGVNFRSRFFPMFATPSSARVLIQSSRIYRVSSNAGMLHQVRRRRCSADIPSGLSVCPPPPHVPYTLHPALASRIPASIFTKPHSELRSTAHYEFSPILKHARTRQLHLRRRTTHSPLSCAELVTIPSSPRL